MPTIVEHKENKQSKAKTKQLWKWIDRPLSDEFYKTAGRLGSKDVYQQRWNEIPDEFKFLAYVIIQTAYAHQEAKKATPREKKNKKAENYFARTIDEADCLVYRCMLFDGIKKLEQKGIDIHMPYYWYTDAVMIEPEWIVSITNGIVGWTCDSSRENCSRCGECRFSVLFGGSKMNESEMPRLRTIPKSEGGMK